MGAGSSGAPLTQALGAGAVPVAASCTGEGCRPQHVETPLAVVHDACAVFKALRDTLWSMANGIFHMAWVRAVHDWRDRERETER